MPRPEGAIVTEKETVVTEEGLRKLEAELEELKTVHRKEVKQEQAFIEGRIMKLEAMIRNAKIIHEGEGGADEVHLGSTVKVKNLNTQAENEYTIVGSAESDPPNAKISNESPIGKAVVGAKPGQTVVAATPSGDVQYKVLSIRANRRSGSKARSK
jgi:transcription elongation factor GreA